MRDILRISFILRQNKSYSESFYCRKSWVSATSVLCVIPTPSQLNIGGWLACSPSSLLMSVYSGKANRLVLHSGRFARMLVGGIESDLLSFHFHKHGSLLAVSPNVAVLGEFVQQTSSLEYFKSFGQSLRFSQCLCSPLWPKPHRGWHIIIAVYPESITHMQSILIAFPRIKDAAVMSLGPLRYIALAQLCVSSVLLEGI